MSKTNECFETGLGRFCLGDARVLIKGVPASSVDAVVTDPPWGLGLDQYDDGDAYYRLLPELYRVLRPGGALVVYYAVRFLDRLIIETTRAGFKYYWLLVRLDFSKATRSPFGMNNYTPAVVFYKGQPPKIKFKSTDVLSSGEIDYDLMKNVTKEVFDQFKSTAVTTFIIQSLTREGETVLDPFAGYGSIPFVAETHRRRWLAFELARERYEIARHLILNKTMPNLKEPGKRRRPLPI